MAKAPDQATQGPSHDDSSQGLAAVMQQTAVLALHGRAHVTMDALENSTRACTLRNSPKRIDHKPPRTPGASAARHQTWDAEPNGKLTQLCSTRHEPPPAGTPARVTRPRPAPRPVPATCVRMHIASPTPQAFYQLRRLREQWPGGTSADKIAEGRVHPRRHSG